jgi:hypothetical protein
LSAAGEVISSPSCLLLDEPTSGLSAADGFVLVRVLRDLVETGDVDVILCTVHQPRSDIFGLFTHLHLLCAGESVYNGPVLDALPFFERVSSMECPSGMNAADWIMDLVSIDQSTYLSSLDIHVAPKAMSKGQLHEAILLSATTRSTSESTRRSAALTTTDALVMHASPNLIRGPTKLDGNMTFQRKTTSWILGFWKDVRILFRRNSIECRRSWKGIGVSMCNLGLLVIVLGLVWSQAPNDKSVTSQFQLQNLIYISVGITSNHVTVELPLILKEKEIFRKEYNAGCRASEFLSLNFFNLLVSLLNFCC